MDNYVGMEEDSYGPRESFAIVNIRVYYNKIPHYTPEPSSLPLNIGFN